MFDTFYWFINVLAKSCQNLNYRLKLLIAGLPALFSDAIWWLQVMRVLLLFKITLFQIV